ncbi:flagellar biosynthetic protein FlhB [Sulfurivirga caldicuralii]|uniref:Flagellar biosynthetic protein FlhB n=1 Tax=Sulfurivirga caldicuralii TaxID=364032 RepID=A0A1N6FL45_9GAMM|nr:flagellar biosynthesis protein FlhB [Sulfurivirga caldicuralii]SIN95956.1 flagellar biosynthetic protein FlhB [Sulfurivirga caldicuralii]
MAENADGQEKSEQPTEKKLREAREKGQVPRSKELATVLMLLGAGVYFLVLGPYTVQQFEALMREGLSLDRAHAFDLKKDLELIIGLFVQAWAIVWPFLAVMVVIAVASPLLIGGWNFAPKALAPNFAKLNPITGFAKLFSLRNLLELVKALLKVSLVALVAVLVIGQMLDQLLGLAKLSLLNAMGEAASIVVWSFILISLSLIVVALIDVPYQLWEHTRQMMMTRQEVKEEFKQQEGDPQVKGRIRQLQHEMAQRRMLQKVPEADVVITNPTHFAVALKYDPATMREPIVLAMGADLMASQIRTLAKKHHVPVVEAPALARALYYNAQEGAPIPYQLFRAVAAVLAYVYQLRDGQAATPPDFEHLPVPEEMTQPPP